MDRETLRAKSPSLIGTAGCVIRTSGGVGPVAELILSHGDPIELSRWRGGKQGWWEVVAWLDKVEW